MTQVTFGETTSLVLSIATVQRQAKEHKEEHPMAVEEVYVIENMYVDDVPTSTLKMTVQ